MLDVVGNYKIRNNENKTNSDTDDYVVFTTTSAFSQEKFRVDYGYVAWYNPKTETWSDWQEGDNTFVININKRGDIAHLKANGKTVIYKRN